MPSDENMMMNDILRKAGVGGTSVAEPETPSSSGSREFTVQPPGVEAPDDQFVYEPMPDTPGAWAVYPPGVPCETGQYRISRSSPAGVADFPKMQRALDEEGGESDMLPMDAMMEEEDEEADGGY